MECEWEYLPGSVDCSSADCVRYQEVCRSCIPWQFRFIDLPTADPSSLKYDAVKDAVAARLNELEEDPE